MTIVDRSSNILQRFTTPAVLRDRQAAIEEGLRSSCKLLQADTATLTLLGQREPLRHSFSTDNKLQTRPAPRSNSGLVRAVMREESVISIPETSLDSRFTKDDWVDGFVTRNVVSVPLQQRMQNIGVLSVHNLSEQMLQSSHLTQTLFLLSTCIGLGLENCRLARTVRKVAVTDDLTQVYNYRFLRSALRREMKRAGRFRQSFALLMVDVDHLKEYNDREGHLKGSHLLRDLARILSRGVRGMDLLAKYGGDEFTVILPQTPRSGGMAVAERVRAAVEDHTFNRCEPGEMTVSVGVAMFPEDGIQPAALIAASDAALYAAKQRGRNQVTEATGLILRGESDLSA